MTKHPSSYADRFTVSESENNGKGCTAQFQKVIDACADAGGGQVVVPAGRYVIGTIYLKSHVELHLRAGATLVASSDQADYNVDDIFPENERFTRRTKENVGGGHLIIAYKQENVSITGSGTIDGNSSSFFEPLPEDDPGIAGGYRYKYANFPIPGWRPAQMIFFCRCKQAAVRDVTLLNAPYWTLFLLGCQDAHLRGLTITNPPATQNGDGIDIDCCQNVTVSDCIIRTGDDSITVRGDNSNLIYADSVTKESSKSDKATRQRWACENVVVTNCILSSPCNAIRIGVGDGIIRRCRFSNIIITESRVGINIACRYSPNNNHGVSIEQVHFQGFTIDSVQPIAITSGRNDAPAAPPATIKDITFDGFHITATAGAQLVGSKAVPLKRIQLRNVDVHLDGGTDNCEYAQKLPDSPRLHSCGLFDQPAFPCAIFGRHLKDALFEGVRIFWGDNLSKVWRDGLLFEKSQNIELHHLDVQPPRADIGMSVRCDAA